MMFGKDKERMEMLERITDSLSRSIDDLTAEVNVLRTELDEFKNHISAKNKKSIVLKKPKNK